MSAENAADVPPAPEAEAGADAEHIPVESAAEPRTDDGLIAEEHTAGEPSSGRSPQAARDAAGDDVQDTAGKGSGDEGGTARKDTAKRSPADDLQGEEHVDFGANVRERQNGLLAHRAAVSGDGLAMYVENFNADGRRSVGVRISRFTQERVLDLYEDVPGQSEIEQALKEHRVVVLWGRVGSGRRSTAAVLLARRVARYRIRLVHADGGGDPLQALCEAPGQLVEGHGYLLDAGDRPVTPEMLDRLVHVVTDRGAHLVVIGTRASTGSEPLRGQVFEHVHPDLARVLEKHLVALLAGHVDGCPRARGPEQHTCDTAAVDRYVAQMLDHPEVQPLVKVPPVEQVVDLARYLASAIHSEEPDLLAIWRDRMRHLARRMLSGDGDPEEGAPAAAHVQPFRMAYAMFHLHPLADAFTAGEVLSAEILPLYETRESPPPGHVFNRDLARLIPVEMRSADDADGATPRRAHLVDVNLLHAFLEVAWHEYDSLRSPLLNWLTALLGRSDLGLERVRVRVAEIAGILLRHDFDGVYRQLIRPWANGESAVYRQCAAVAMEAAFLDEGLKDRVAGQVRDWSNSPGLLLQDSAARTYGTQVGLSDVPAALRQLTSLGARPELAARNSVAFSTAWLYLNGEEDAVIAQLGAWLDASSDHLTRHAVRTTLTLSRFGSGPGRRGRPALAERALVDEQFLDLLAALLARALLSAETSTRAWDLIRQWLVAADDHEDLAALFETLALRIFSRALRSRALWHLHVWALRHTKSPTLRRIDLAVRTASGPHGR
ncbi:hypothetical protein ACVHNB_23730 [Streptomyces sp. YJ-C3]